MFRKYAILDEQRMYIARKHLTLPNVVMDIVAEYVHQSEELDRITRVFANSANDAHGFMYGCDNLPLQESETEYDRQWLGLGLSYQDDKSPASFGIKNPDYYSLQFGDSFQNYMDFGGCAYPTLHELLPSNELKMIAGSPWYEHSWYGCGKLLLRGKDQFLTNLVLDMDALDENP